MSSLQYMAFSNPETQCNRFYCLRLNSIVGSLQSTGLPLILFNTSASCNGPDSHRPIHDLSSALTFRLKEQLVKARASRYPSREKTFKKTTFNGRQTLRQASELGKEKSQGKQEGKKWVKNKSERFSRRCSWLFQMEHRQSEQASIRNTSLWYTSGISFDGGSGYEHRRRVR